MIDFKTLRIGNIVNEKVLGNVIVMGIHGRQAWVSNPNESLQYGINDEFLYPIPLTPEILEKFGFIKTGGYNWDFKNETKAQNIVLNGCWLDDSCAEWYFTFKQKQAKFFLKMAFIHQLQNTFHCFTGEELEIYL